MTLLLIVAFKMLYRSLDHFSKIDTSIKYFNIVPALRSADIISSRHVHSQMECSFGCLNKQSCVGFKYRDGSSSASNNCQLSNATCGDNMEDYSDQGWLFFIDVSKFIPRCTHISIFRSNYRTIKPNLH